MLAIRFTPELLNDIDLLAKEKQINRSALIREAIIRYLEDNEDLKAAKSAEKNLRSSKTLLQLRTDLGLDS